DQAAPAPGDQVQIALEVADNRLNRDPRVVRRDLARARLQGFFVHVERDEAGERAGGVERVQEEADVLRGSGAELDERACASATCDRGRPGAQDLVLATREVVLREVRDLVV